MDNKTRKSVQRGWSEVLFSVVAEAGGVLPNSVVGRERGPTMSQASEGIRNM